MAGIDISALTASLAAASTDLDGAVNVLQRAIRLARDSEQRMGRAGLRRIAYRLRDVVEDTRKSGQTLVAQRTAITETAARVQAVPDGATAEQVITALEPAVATLHDVPGHLGTATTNLRQLQATVADILKGAKPGPLIGLLGDVDTRVRQASAAVAEATTSAERILAAAREAGRLDAPGIGGPRPTSSDPPAKQRRERPAWLRRMDDGNAFNDRDRVNYDLNEIELETGKRMDSYVHGKEIIERKYTQLAEIEEATAIGYLRSARRKYKEGNIIADKPRSQALCPELIGSPTRGKLILKVPAQKAPVPEAVLKAARRLRIEIRQVEDEKDT